MQPLSGIKDEAYRAAQALLKPGGRAESNRYLVEGENLVRQALKTPDVKAVYATPESATEFREACATQGLPLYVAGGGLMQKLVGTGYETAVTTLAIVDQKKLDVDDWLPPPGSLVLACERIQDPRNVGVLIRTAEAAGCAAILFSSDSAEPWQRAAVRSTTGSILRLPVGIVDDLPFHLKRLRQAEVPIVATSAKAPCLAYEANLQHRPLIIVVGNETEGMSEAAREAASEFVALPMAPSGASSLNVTVAAGVLLYEAVRQAIRN
jgi:TrmH family RNA methyltransferase